MTDGDLRRLLSDHEHLEERTARDVMSSRPHTIGPSALAVEALRLMETHRITALIVVDESHHAQGVVHLHDLWRTELF